MRRLSFLIAGMLAVGGCGAAWAQLASVEQQFAACHRTLTGTADSLLAAPPVKVEVATPAAPSKGQTINPKSALARVQKIRPLLEPILREEGVPTKFAAVVVVE